MPSEDTKVLEFNQYRKSDKASFIIYADLECIIENIDGYKNNPENSFTKKLEDEVVNKRVAGIIWKWKSLLYL